MDEFEGKGFTIEFPIIYLDHNDFIKHTLPEGFNEEQTFTCTVKIDNHYELLMRSALHTGYESTIEKVRNILDYPEYWLY